MKNWVLVLLVAGSWAVPAAAIDDVQPREENKEFALSAERENYALGEPVKITITNKKGGVGTARFDVNASLMLGDFDDWADLFMGEPGITVPDGQSVSWIWKQVDDDGKKMTRGGVYSLQIVPREPVSMDENTLDIRIHVSGDPKKGPELFEIMTDQPFYLPGEPVSIRVRAGAGEHQDIYVRLYVVQEGRIIFAGNEGRMVNQQKETTWTWKTAGDLRPGGYTIEVDAERDDQTAQVSRQLACELLPKPTAGQNLVVRTTKTQYGKKEPVKMVILNQNRNGLRVSSWRILRGTKPFFNSSSAEMPATVPGPGRGIWSWNQKNRSGAQAPVGKYTAEVTIRIPGDPNNPYRVTSAFRIVSR